MAHSTSLPGAVNRRPGCTAPRSKPIRLAAKLRSGNTRRMTAADFRCVIGLGANLGDKVATFEAALDALSELGELLAISRLYETPPAGGPVQPDYFNAAACLQTRLAPPRLLRKLLDIEHSHGRIREIRWGPRVLDLDILWIQGVIVDEPGLKVPHPRLLERNFALIPLLEVVPEARDPNTGKAYRDHPTALKTDGLRACGVLGSVAG